MDQTRGAADVDEPGGLPEPDRMAPDAARVEILVLVDQDVEGVRMPALLPDRIGLFVTRTATLRAGERAGRLRPGLSERVGGHRQLPVVLVDRYLGALHQFGKHRIFGPVTGQLVNVPLVRFDSALSAESQPHLSEVLPLVANIHDSGAPELRVLWKVVGARAVAAVAAEDQIDPLHLFRQDTRFLEGEIHQRDHGVGFLPQCRQVLHRRGDRIDGDDPATIRPLKHESRIVARQTDESETHRSRLGSVPQVDLADCGRRNDRITTVLPDQIGGDELELGTLAPCFEGFETVTQIDRADVCHQVIERVHPLDEGIGLHLPRDSGISGEGSRVDEDHRGFGVSVMHKLAITGPPGQTPFGITGSAAGLDPADDLGSEDEVQIGRRAGRQQRGPGRLRCGAAAERGEQKDHDCVLACQSGSRSTDPDHALSSTREIIGSLPTMVKWRPFLAWPRSIY